jgi:hypothetical protein
MLKLLDQNGTSPQDRYRSLLFESGSIKPSNVLEQEDAIEDLLSKLAVKSSFISSLTAGTIAESNRMSSNYPGMEEPDVMIEAVRNVQFKNGPESLKAKNTSSSNSLSVVVNGRR